MLFGTDSEPTHYSKLLAEEKIAEKLSTLSHSPNIDRNALRTVILNSANISLEEYDAYWTRTTSYRNQSLIHREHHPNKIRNRELQYPILDPAKQTLMSLYILLIKLARTYPNEPDQHNVYPVEFISEDSIDKLESYLQSVNPNINFSEQ